MKRLLMILSLLFSVSAFADVSDKQLSRSLDCNLIKGAGIASKALNFSNLDGYGDSNYHIRGFEILRNSGIYLSRALRNELVPALNSPSLKKGVLSITQNLDNSLQEGSGDASYWSMAVSTKVRDLKAAINSLNDLASIACE